MKNSIFSLLVSLLIVSSSLSGCASIGDPIGDFIGTGLSDLQKARANGLTRDFPIAYDAAFDTAIDVIKANNLVSYQSDRKKGYIVFMGLPKQVDTTRVGVFFESLDSSTTRITISSLSSTALAKAGSLIFGGLETAGPSGAAGKP